MEASGPFSAEVVSALQSLYKRGMTGWGKKHSSSLEVVVRSTGLNLGQVKVSGEGSASDLSITTTIIQNWIQRRNMKRKAEEMEREDETQRPLKKASHFLAGVFEAVC